MMDETQVNLIQQLAQPILAQSDIELIELSCHRQGGQLMVRLLVDKVSGITIQECAQLNWRISAALDADPSLQESYTLEVSSPGLDRPLVSKRDYERAIGEDVQVEVLREGDRGPKPVRGRVLAVQHEALVLTTSAGNVTIPFTQIQRAKKALQW